MYGDVVIAVFNRLNPFVIRSCFQTKDRGVERDIISPGLNPFIVRSCFRTRRDAQIKKLTKESQSLYSQVMLSNVEGPDLGTALRKLSQSLCSQVMLSNGRKEP